MSKEISVSELSTSELEQYEEMLYDQILDLRYIEKHLNQIEEDLRSINGQATNVFETVPESFPTCDTESALADVVEKRETLENKHHRVEEELGERQNASS